jgi:3-hydroxyisobutyrate dehydrogenase-like beta-hydroxyacid dehydrogenase
VKVSILGLGRMGLAYGERLISKGHEVVGYDISPPAMSAFAQLGGRAAGSTQELVGVPGLLLVSLPDAATVLPVVRDLLDHAQALPGLIDLSTTGPQGAVALAGLLAEASAPYAEAPVSGGVSGALSGRLTLMAAGSPELLTYAEPVLGALGNVVRLGDRPGQGQAMKVLNNLLSATSLAVTSEALAAGVAVGLDPAQMLEVFNGGSGKNAATLDKFPKYVLPGTFDQGFAATLMSKDVRLAQELFHQAGIPAWVAAAVVETWVAACSRLEPGADFTEIARVHASYLSPEAWTSSTIYEEQA